MKMKNGLLQRLAAALVALALLMGMCAMAQAEDEVITAREMMALLDDFVADKGAEHLAEWQAMFPAARASDAQLTRADGICMLYGAACTARPDKVELGDNCWTLHEKIGEKIWDEYHVNEALFGETVYEPSPWHEWNYSASAYFFALDVRDWDGEMLFDYDPEANTLHTDAPLTRADAETAIARLTSRWSPLEGSMTAREMMARLDQFVEAAAPEKLGEWQAMFQAARESDEMLTRADGVFAVYCAACTAQTEQLEIGENWVRMGAKIGDIWNGYNVNHDIFGGMIDQTTPWHWHEWSCGAAALFFALDFHDWRGEMLFEYDEEANSLHLDQPLMSADVERAINMLTQAMSPTQERAVEADAEYLAQMEAKKQEILNSASEYEVKGKVYYIANDGDDNNNGRSAKYPWKTLARSYREGLQPGDVVLLKRGDLWREVLECASGVTYSAYCEGEKPRIYGSPESGADKAKWELYYDQDGVKIWRFYKDIYDCGCIVFNEGESYALRVFSGWDGERETLNHDLSKPFNMIDELKVNHQYYHDLTGSYYLCDVSGTGLPADKLKGTIYLRCDEGNPGELYDDLEFVSALSQYEDKRYGLVMVYDKDVVIDNLCMRYSVRPTVFSHTASCTVRNCEVGWEGGEMLGLDEHNGAAGEGIRIAGNCIVKHNYVYQCFDGGVTIEPSYETEGDRYWMIEYHNIMVEDNLIEYCNSGLYVTGITREIDEKDRVLRNIAFRNNDVLFSGYGWSGDPDYDFGWKHPTVIGNAVLLGYDDYPVENFVFENNTFYKAKHAVVLLPEFTGEKPLFTGNRYMQNENGIAVALMLYGEVYDTAARSEDAEELREIYAQYLGDTQAVID